MLLAAPLAARAECAADGKTSTLMSEGPVQVVVQPRPQPIEVGRPFELLLTLCPAQAELVRVDATMPAHRHGMNYRPSVHKEGEGRWRVEGLLWHMSGLWELQVHVKLQQQTYTLRQNVTLR